MLGEFARALWTLTLEMAPWLLLGFLLAGLLKALVPQGLIAKHLGTGWRGPLKAAVIGVPLPLCSCGVVPTALSLRDQGARRPSVLSFLVATPQTGVDSILVTAAFLTWPLALFKVAVALIGGTLTGWLARGVGLDRDEHPVIAMQALHSEAPRRSVPRRLWEGMRYAFWDFPLGLVGPLVLGILLAAGVATVVQPEWFATLTQTTAGYWATLGIVLAISLVLYICSTGSVPLAAMLIVTAGFSPGIALVLLIAGPVTNLATITVVGKALGKRALAVYIGSAVALALGSAALFDTVFASWLTRADIAARLRETHAHGPNVVAVVSAVLLTALTLVTLWRRYGAPALKRWRDRSAGGTSSPAPSGQELRFTLSGLTCGGCIAHLTQSLQALPGVQSADVDLAEAVVRGTDLQTDTIIAATREAGYQANPVK